MIIYQRWQGHRSNCVSDMGSLFGFAKELTETVGIEVNSNYLLLIQ